MGDICSFLLFSFPFSKFSLAGGTEGGAASFSIWQNPQMYLAYILGLVCRTVVGCVLLGVTTFTGELLSVLCFSLLNKMTLPCSCMLVVNVHGWVSWFMNVGQEVVRDFSVSLVWSTSFLLFLCLPVIAHIASPGSRSYIVVLSCEFPADRKRTGHENWLVNSLETLIS